MACALIIMQASAAISYFVAILVQIWQVDMDRTELNKVLIFVRIRAITEIDSVFVDKILRTADPPQHKVKEVKLMFLKRTERGSKLVGKGLPDSMYRPNYSRLICRSDETRTSMWM